MRYYALILTLIVGFLCGRASSEFDLMTGNVIFKNLKDVNGTTTADVFIVGERSLLTKQLTIIAEEWPLYDSKGNRLVRLLEENR
jgi:hypothetical protein